MAQYVDVEKYLNDNFCDEYDECVSDEDCFVCWARRHTEDVAPVIHAKWVELENSSYLDPRMVCSNCGNISTPLGNWKCCPICEAKMDKE